MERDPILQKAGRNAYDAAHAPVVQYTPVPQGPAVDQQAVNDMEGEPQSEEEALAQAAEGSEAAPGTGGGGSVGGSGYAGPTMVAKTSIKHGRPEVGGVIHEGARTVAELGSAAAEKEAQVRNAAGQIQAARDVAYAGQMARLSEEEAVKAAKLAEKKEKVRLDLERLTQEGFGEEAVWQSKGNAARVAAAIGSAVGAGLAFWTGQPNHIENQIRASIDSEIASRRGKGALYQSLLDKFGDQEKAMQVQDELNRKRITQNIDSQYNAMVAMLGGPKNEAAHLQTMAGIAREYTNSEASAVDKATNAIETEQQVSMRVGGGGAPSGSEGGAPSAAAPGRGSAPAAPAAPGTRASLAQQRLAHTIGKDEAKDDEEMAKTTAKQKGELKDYEDARNELAEMLKKHKGDKLGVPGLGVGATNSVVDFGRKVVAEYGPTDAMKARAEEGLTNQLKIANIINARILARGGQAVSAQEAVRLAREIDFSMPPAVIMVAIDNIAKRVARELRTTEAGNPQAAMRVRQRESAMEQGAANFNARVERLMRERKVESRAEAESIVKAQDRAKKAKEK
jgi:hypothetical protein